MTHITITDLPLDAELDREAMTAIAGGSRASAGQPRSARHCAVRIGSSCRVVDYPPGFTHSGEGPAPNNGQRSPVT